MIVSFPISRSFTGLKQEIARNKLEYHACETPHICGGVVVYAQHNLWRTVLTGLNSLGEVEMRPATITQVAYFHIYILIYLWTSFMEF